jgi:osmotically-inducible protein OsmY
MDIRDAVESELIFDPLVDETNITVKNMNGEVALNGTVLSYPQYLEAAAAARRVVGVKNVHNHLEVVLPPGDNRDDATLTTMANNALALNITVPDGVEATARNGNIKLTGTVSHGLTARPGRTGRRQADRCPQHQGRHRDRLGRDPVGVTLAVRDALARYALIPDDSDVVVETSANTVTLSGHVRTWAERDTVVSAAWMANGVVEVDDNLYIG